MDKAKSFASLRRDRIRESPLTDSARNTRDDGWRPLSSVAAALFAVEPGFKPRRYGSTSLRALVESSSPEVETKRIPSGLMVRARAVAGEADRPPSAA